MVEERDSILRGEGISPPIRLRRIIPARWAATGLLAFGILCISRICAQQVTPTPNAGKQPSFEVATIKPSKPGRFGSDFDTDGNRLTIQNFTVRRMIRVAYGLKSDSQILGGPDWIDKQTFDVVAKVDDAEAARMDKMTDERSGNEWNLLLQSLLADRFQLKVTQSERVLPIFALVVSRAGVKMKPAKPGENGDLDGWGGHLSATAITMDGFADDLTQMRDIAGRVVLNRTSLPSAFDFNLDWSRDRGDGASQDSPYPGLFTALQEQLGLKLKPGKASVPVVVIKSAAPPTVN